MHHHQSNDSFLTEQLQAYQLNPAGHSSKRCQFIYLIMPLHAYTLIIFLLLFFISACHIFKKEYSKNEERYMWGWQIMKNISATRAPSLVPRLLFSQQNNLGKRLQEFHTQYLHFCFFIYLVMYTYVYHHQLQSLERYRDGVWTLVTLYLLFIPLHLVEMIFITFLSSRRNLRMLTCTR